MATIKPTTKKSAAKTVKKPVTKQTAKKTPAKKPAIKKTTKAQAKIKPSEDYMKRRTGSLSKKREIRFNYFITSLNINTHPFLKKWKRTKQTYFTVLEYFINYFILDAEYVNARLSQYRSLLVGEETLISLTDETCAKAIQTVVNDFLKPWKRNHHLILLCDIALIISHRLSVEKALGMLAKYINTKKQERLNALLAALYDNNAISPVFKSVENMITQFRVNREFATQQEIRIMVTANMSAGKSTLINALIGKPLTRTAQEACTANLCYLYNKPFEDGRIHLLESSLNLNAAYDDITKLEKTAVSSMASYFRVSGHPRIRVCLIDTPGANSALNSGHKNLTHKAIVEENYDKLICVLNANNLGSDDEIKHLKYIYKNVPSEKVIFVLNKLDGFKTAEDSIAASIDGVRADLKKIGYENPVICPLSAYFAMLLKMKKNGEKLCKQEERSLQRFIEDFNEPEYDLSAYCDKSVEDITYSDDEFLKMSHLSGLCNLENILYGGSRK